MQVGVDVKCMHTNFGGCDFLLFQRYCHSQKRQIEVDVNVWKSILMGVAFQVFKTNLTTHNTLDVLPKTGTSSTALLSPT